jgi:hypothetical protein
MDRIGRVGGWVKEGKGRRVQADEGREVAWCVMFGAWCLVNGGLGDSTRGADWTDGDGDMPRHGVAS